MSDNLERQVNVRLSKEHLAHIKRRGKRSNVIRMALDLFFRSNPPAPVTLESLDEKIDSKFDEVIELLKEKE